MADENNSPVPEEKAESGWATTEEPAAHRSQSRMDRLRSRRILPAKRA
jgi:hypothetical protein